MRWMCWFTSSELEIDSLIAVPSSRKSCLILSSKGMVPFQRNAQRSLVRHRRTSIFRSDESERILFVPCFQRLQTGRHRFPQLRPVSQVFPPAPLRVAPQHGAVRDAPATVVALADKAPELGIDSDEIVTPVHGQQ